MADRNWNQRYDDDRRDWDNDRYNQQNDYSQRRQYGNTGGNRNYNEDYMGRGSSDAYQSHGNWGSQHDNINAGRYGSGGYNQDYNDPYQSRNRGNVGHNQQSYYGGSNWGNQQGLDEWHRRQNQGSAGMYGGDFGPEEWERTNYNRSYGGNQYGQSQNRNWQDRHFGGYSPGYNEQRSYSGNDQNWNRRNRNDDDRSWWDRTREKVSSWFDDDDDRRRNQGQTYQGGYRGKGPKDYQRSSERIREDVCDRLSDDDRLDATNISVQVQGNEVVLTGTVRDRYQKRYAEDLVESISGVRHVENRLRVGDTADLQTHNYTNNSDNFGGVGDESGTTNEIIRNANRDRNRGV